MQVIEELVKIGEKGRITLPAKIQESADLKEGDFLVVNEIEGIIMIKEYKG